MFSSDEPRFPPNLYCKSTIHTPIQCVGGGQGPRRQDESDDYNSSIQRNLVTYVVSRCFRRVYEIWIHLKNHVMKIRTNNT